MNWLKSITFQRKRIPFSFVVGWQTTKLGFIISCIRHMNSRTKTNYDQEVSNDREKDLGFIDFVIQEVV